MLRVIKSPTITEIIAVDSQNVKKNNKKSPCSGMVSPKAGGVQARGGTRTSRLLKPRGGL